MDKFPGDTNGDLPNPYLELPHDELDALFKDVAGALVRRGEIVPLVSELPTDNEAPMPNLFQMDVPSAVVKEVFYADDEAVIPLEGIATYQSAHRLEAANPSVYEDLMITYPCVLGDSGVVWEKYVRIAKEDGEYNTEVNVNITGPDGQRINPAGFEFSEDKSPFATMTEYLLGYAMYRRPVAQDDVRQLQRVAERLDQPL